MKLSQYQQLEQRSRSRHATAGERAEAAKQLATARVTGTVFRAVFFGSGCESVAEAVSLLVAQTHHSSKSIKTRIANAAVTVAGGETAYTDREVAEAIGQSAIGTGSCTSYRIVEQDIDAVGADISEPSGEGWRQVR